jgi:transposase InsO family protein
MISAIREQSQSIPIGFLCGYFSVSRSGFYHWQKTAGKTVRFVKKQSICEAVETIFRESKETYGSPRVWDALKERGYQVSLNTVAKYMVELGLDARLKKRFRVQTTDSNHPGPIAERLFKVEDENTMPRAPGEILAGDITYLKLAAGGFVYLAVVIDIYTREVLGWSMQKNLRTKLVLDALAIAIKKVGPDAQVMFHSDRGAQYASEAYRKLCKNCNVTLSMSRRGNCYDNAYVESWFASLKKEWIYRQEYRTEEELKALVFDYIEPWYNRKRKHSALDYMSPMQFKEAHAAR